MITELHWIDPNRAVPPMDHKNRYHLLRWSDNLKIWPMIAMCRWNGHTWEGAETRHVALWAELDDPFVG